MNTIMDPDRVGEVVSANIRRMRREKRWSQVMMAHFAGLHPTEISRLERNHRNPRLLTIAKIAKAFKVPIADLLVDHESEE